uniref:Uncharacterized protein n=1 Tax=Rhinolophus ferrumequinum TaxID=59479 RepID=A0A671DMJ6_RHIFE
MVALSAAKVVLKKYVQKPRYYCVLKNKQLMSVNIWASMQQQQQLVSARNRPLAQKMEDRPSSLKQHLGKS